MALPGLFELGARELRAANAGSRQLPRCSIHDRPTCPFSADDGAYAGVLTNFPDLSIHIYLLPLEVGDHFLCVAASMASSSKMPRTLNGAPASTRDAAPTPSTLLSKRAADA